MLGYNQSHPSNTYHLTVYSAPMLSSTQHFFKSRILPIAISTSSQSIAINTPRSSPQTVPKTLDHVAHMVRHHAAATTPSHLARRRPPPPCLLLPHARVLHGCHCHTHESYTAAAVACRSPPRPPPGVVSHAGVLHAYRCHTQEPSTAATAVGRSPPWPSLLHIEALLHRSRRRSPPQLRLPQAGVLH
jgi:hypothetical protein